VVAQDAELLFDYGDQYWGALDEGRPVEAGDAGADAAPWKRRRVVSGAHDDSGWEAHLATLAAYKVERGDCNVPYRWAVDPALGAWVHHQRRFKKQLDCGEPSKGMTVARVAKLDALGFAWDFAAAAMIEQKGKGARDDAGWAAWLAKLKAYRRTHGDCNVPHRWAEDPLLGSWVNTQRKFKKALDCGEPGKGMTAARAAKLDALGFAWDFAAAAMIDQKGKGARDDAGWEAQLAKLKAYTGHHGDCNVPQGWTEDPQLGNWVHRQRQRKKALDRGEPSAGGMTAARVAKLDALGFEWELSAAARNKQTAKYCRCVLPSTSWLCLVLDLLNLDSVPIGLRGTAVVLAIERHASKRSGPHPEV
jgi:hypothetical protein